MLLYILLLIFLFAVSFFTKARLPKDLNFILFVVINLLLIVFVGLRGNIDPDYSNYLDVFKTSGGIYHASNGIEVGYYLLNHYLLLWKMPFQTVILIMAIFSIYFKIDFFYRFSPNYGLSIFVYFCSILFLFDFIAIRQAVTLSIFMVSLPYIYERRFWPYCILLLLASLIHITAILLIPFYFILNRKFNKKTLYAIIIICAIINLLKFTVPLVEVLLKFIYIPGVSADKLNVYLQETDYAPISIKQLILCFLFVFLNFHKEEKSEMFNILINMFVFGVLIGTVFNELPQFAYRMKWYFFWTESILVVNLIDYIARNNLKLTYFLYTVVLLLYGYTMINFLSQQADRDKTYFFPYKFFFQQ